MSEDDERYIYLSPEQRKIAQGEKNRLMSAALTKLVGMPVHVDDTVPTGELRFVKDGKIVGRIVNASEPSNAIVDKGMERLE
jgi:hypothetical protein